jgi:hypothetical protein
MMVSVSGQQALATSLSPARKHRSIRRSAVLIWGSVTYRVRCFFLNHHLPSKLMFALLRRVRPVAIVGRNVIATKASDIRDVLDRFDGFMVLDGNRSTK